MQGKVALSRAEGAPGLEAKVVKGGSRRASRLEQTVGEAYKVCLDSTFMTYSFLFDEVRQQTNIYLIVKVILIE